MNKKNIYFSEIYRGLGNAQLKDGKKDMALRYYQESLKYFEAVDKAKEPISDSFAKDIDIVKCSVVELSTVFGNKAFEDKDFSKALDYFMDILNY
ncbi:hypothetical protein KBA27_06065, partial [bacterium]|nr:hypothetical protein [bacterium]